VDVSGVVSNNAIGFTTDAASLGVGQSLELVYFTRLLSGVGKVHCCWSCSVESQSFNSIKRNGSLHGESRLEIVVVISCKLFLSALCMQFKRCVGTDLLVRC
jgi:hypothetical protein